MKKIITITLVLTLTLGLMLTARAQDELYVYRHGGVTDTLRLSEVKGISHSRVDLLGRQHADYVLMDVRLADGSVRQFPLEGLDSVVMQRDGERYRLVRFTGGMSSDGGSGIRKALRRTSLDVLNVSASSAEGVEFFWEDGDKIYIDNGDGYPAADSVFIRDGKAVAEFFFKTHSVPENNVPVYYPGQETGSYNRVEVKTVQMQSAPSSSAHIGLSGDCGTAVATKSQDGKSYNFVLDHKASYLCFLPYIANDLGRTVLEKVTVRSDSAIAGTFTLTPERIIPRKDTTHVITLTTKGHFVLPRQASLENSAAYMVIAPQNGNTRLTCEFTVRDTVLQSTGVYTKTVDLDEVKSNMVYVVKANCNNYVVDLGLPVKFLNHNMGAFAPEDYGGYYAYGELNDKGDYSKTNYIYQSTPREEITNIRLTDKDVAHMRLGGNFSMPTSAEFIMLVDSCTWTWQSSFKGKPGYKITGKNGNTLFMPAAGYRSGTNNGDINSRGCYRSSQLVFLPSTTKYNWYLNFNSSSRSVSQSGDDIYLGESIRPVVSTGVTMTDGTVISVMTDSVQWSPATPTTATLFGTVYGISKAKTAVELGFVVGDKPTITITSTGTITATAAAARAMEPGATITTDGPFSVDFDMPKDTAYYIRAYAKDKDGNIEYGNALQFGRAYIDLGLPSGTKWANISLGNVTPYQNGNYYAWGETTTKSSYPDNASNYRWYSHGTWIEPDRLLDIQATDNDAASVNWGGVWMTPNTKDLQELVANCDFTASTMNGIKGYTITSRKNDNSLFMPLSGYFRSAITKYNAEGYMASSSLPGLNDQADHATLICNTGVNTWYRADGIPVRPVYKTNAKSADGTPMFIRTLVAAKQYDGQTETDTLKATVRGLAGTTGITVGFSYSTDIQFITDTKVPVTKTTDGQFSYVFTPTTAGERTYYRAFVKSDDTYYYGDTLNVDAVGLVDLGLSVLWANVDIGAASADSHGDFYRWGATKSFLGDNSNYYTGNKDITPLSGHDTATELWGDKYRMPTLTEFRELMDSCDITVETSNNGVVGRRFTSKVKGYTDRSIFLPTSGVFVHNSSYRYAVNSENSHWTSTNYDDDEAYRVFLANDRGANAYKNYGFPVRPVQGKLGSLYNISFSREMVNGVETDKLEGYFHHVSGNSQTAGFLVGGNIILDKDHKLHQYDCTTTTGAFQQTVTGLTPGKRYYYRAFANDGAQWKYTPVDSFDVVGEVDLGLSVKWANVNVGALCEFNGGNFYQWGAIEPFKNTVQYYRESKDITPMGGYDTAVELWGGNWRMPTKEEWKELVDNCTFEWVNSNGYYGVRATSKKSGYTGRSIFLPSSGYYSPSDGSWHRDYSNTSGDYWSSSYSSGNSSFFQTFWNEGRDASPIPDPKNYGFTVRPVADTTPDVNTVNVIRDVNDFTKVSVECNAKTTPANATVGVRYGISRNNLNSSATFATAGQQGRFTVTLTGLIPGTSYYYSAYIQQGGSYIAKGDTLKFTAYELVDLDLPSGLLWLNLDLGADTICGNGDYYRWGATVPYPQEGWDSHESRAQNLTETGHDAVRNTLGSPYRLPMKDEMDELANVGGASNCNWEWTTMNGVPGYKVSSKTHTERFIFLPTTGYLESNASMQYANNHGNWWSSSWHSTNPYARGLGGGSATEHTGDDGNGIDPVYYASFLRPVVSVVSTDKAQVSGAAYQLRGRVHSFWGYSGSVRVGFVYGTSSSPTVGDNASYDVPVSGVSEPGDFSYTLTNLGNNTTYYYRAYIYDGTAYHYGAEQMFMTMGASPAYMAVDLGLPSHTLWANMNIGAESETGDGKYFAWGETQYKTDFSTSTNEHYRDNHYDLIGEDIAGTKYDAARAIMGGIWSMPTKAQFDELMDSRYTSWVWTTVDGRNGYRVTSLVDGYTENSIFIPASGWMNGTTPTAKNSSGYFWLSTLYNGNEAYYTWISSGGKGAEPDPRWEGFPIRGVINNGRSTATGAIGAVTTGVDWAIGAATATLHGNFGITGTVSGVTYGFIVGSSTDVDASTADQANIITANNADAVGNYSVDYNYDGGVRYFRAFAKVGDSYTQGEVKAISVPMLLDVAFAADGTAKNYAFTKQICVKHGTPAMTYNADYKSYEADLSANGFSTTAGHYYSIRFLYDDEFKTRLMDGHTLEAVVKVPYLNSNSESDILANYENGGSGIGIRNKAFFTQVYTNGDYRSVYDADDLDDQTGTYHHVVSVYDKSSARVLLYINGELANTKPAPGKHTMPTADGANYYMVGGEINSSTQCTASWNGSIVFTRIYDDALTASQVQTLYNNLKK